MTIVLILIGICFIAVAAIMLAAVHVGSQWDAAIARAFRLERSQRCRACIAANPDEDCSECGWSEVE